MACAPNAWPRSATSLGDGSTDLRRCAELRLAPYGERFHFDPDDIDKPSPRYDQLRWLEAVGFAEGDVYWMLAGHAIFGGRKR